MGTGTAILTRLAVPHTPTTCPHCSASLEYPSQPPSLTSFELECIKCKKSWTTTTAKSGGAGAGAGASAGAGAGQKGKRRIGTDEKPIDLSYYEILGLPVTCTTADVKKAYRRLALVNHPDKNPGDVAAAERFKDIAIAYNTLSDPGLRHTYNEFGKAKNDGGAEDQRVDPEEIFSQLFGGEGFRDIIGTISLGTEMKSALQDDEDDPPPPPTIGPDGKPIKVPKTPEELEAMAKKKAAKEAAELEKKKVREERVKMLVERLKNNLALYTEQAEGEEDVETAKGVKAIWTIKAEELKSESYGVELLQTVGFVYSSKSKHYLASTGPIPFGLGGWYHSAKSTAHIVNETVSTVRSAYALKEVFEKLSAAEASGLSDEKKKELEDKAAQMGLHALFKGAKLEVEAVIRETCDSLLSEEGVSVEVNRKRAVALGILGGVYESIKKEPGEAEHPLLSAMGGAMGGGGAGKK